MHEVGNRQIHLFKRTYQTQHVMESDGYLIEKTFKNIQELIRFFYHSYNAETKSYWFDDELDVTGKGTVVEHYWTIEDDEFVKITRIRRKRWMIAEEINADWLTVLNPKNYQHQVDDLVRRFGAKKQGPTYRKDPVPGTGKRVRGYYSNDRRVKHTAWYREEIARQKMDKDEYGKFHPTPQPKSLDWNFYHKHSHREFKSWKNQKIQRQWMKNMPRHKERLI